VDRQLGRPTHSRVGPGANQVDWEPPCGDSPSTGATYLQRCNRRNGRMTWSGRQRPVASAYC
jgi:hypothetical protein